MSSKFENRNDLGEKKKRFNFYSDKSSFQRLSRKIYTNDNLINPYDFLDIHISRFEKKNKFHGIEVNKFFATENIFLKQQFQR